VNDEHGELYVGLTGLVLSRSTADVGEGATLRRTSIRLHSESSLRSGVTHAAEGSPVVVYPLRTTEAEITAELFLPADLATEPGGLLELARFLTLLLRHWVNPQIAAPLASTRRLTAASDLWQQARLIEVWPRRSFWRLLDESDVDDGLDWLRNNWRTAYGLYRDAAVFRLAIDALDEATFVENSALALIALWGALEALFSPSTSELRFRVSSLIAAYLEEPGEPRYERQRAIASLYDKRSAAAHGRPKHQSEDVTATYALLVEVLSKLVTEQAVPTKTALERRLFGVALATGEAPK